MFDLWTTDDICDLRGRVAVVTGANGGLGLETAAALAGAGAHVVMAARNAAKADDARRAIDTAHPGASLEVVPLDLSDLDSVASAAAMIRDHHAAIDILVNNAGIMAPPEGRTAQGIELQFGTNHVGHFALTAHLMPALLTARAARVVSVSSVARFMGRPFVPGEPIDSGAYDAWRMYGRSKLANLHFAVELHRRLLAVGAPVASLVAHPGLSNTDLQATSVASSGGGLYQRTSHRASRIIGMTAARGAQSQIRAATDPTARSGQLYAPRFVNAGSPVRRPVLGWSLDRTHGQALWEVSERESGVTFDIAALATGAGGLPD
ncbi:MAG: SDR family NAD(P)-dependent oxidoreductase [Acidimicrobiia bacterium]|nr:SDR family NAD(P)-dependent oxidoreductase [Acidimicrobiia bacterium]